MGEEKEEGGTVLSFPRERNRERETERERKREKEEQRERERRSSGMRVLLAI